MCYTQETTWLPVVKRNDKNQLQDYHSDSIVETETEILHIVLALSENVEKDLIPWSNTSIFS